MQLKLAKKKEINEDVLRMIIQYGLGFASRVKNLEDKCIEKWEADKLYTKEDSFVIYDNYLWQAKVTNQSSAWNENYWKKIGDELDLITKQDIEAMLGLTQEEIETLQKIINDSQITLSTTFSSSRIYSDIQQCLSDSKAFTLSKLASTMTASFEIATSIADITESNILYLLSTGANTYDIYALIEGTPKVIASTTIDLSQFYTKTEIDNDFVKKTDADGKYALITTVDNHINDTVAHMTQSEKDSYALKSSITNTINSTSTSTDIASAKGVYENAIKDKNIKTYTTLEQIGLATTTCTIKDIWDKMPVNSMAIIDTHGLIVTDLDVIATALNTTTDTIYGFLTIGKFAKRTILEFRRSYTDSAIEPETFIGYCVGKNCTSIQWKKMILSSIEGANKVTTITFSATTNYKQRSGFELKYYTLNGVCYVSGGVDCVKPSSALTKLATISKPKIGYVYAKGIVVNNTASDNTLLTLYINDDGSLQFQNGLAGGSYRFSFSYPIA